MEPIRFSCPTMGEAEASAAAAAIQSGWIVGGPRLKAFEEQFAGLIGARHAVGVSSWTTGAFLVLHAWGIGPGDEVIVPSYSFIATANVVSHCGAQVVFADIRPDTWNIDPDDVESRITSRTKAIIPVDQVGLPCEIEAIRAIATRHGLKVLEDAACAIGSRFEDAPVGAHADASVFSLHARKLISCGEGGIISTDDDVLADRLRSLRHQGASLSDDRRHSMTSTTFEVYEEVGFNFRMTDIQAAIALAQLGRLEDILTRRRAQAEHYQAYVKAHPQLQAAVEPEGRLSNWQSYMLGVLPEAPLTRNELMTALDERGVPTRRSVMASHLEPAYGGQTGMLPNTERAFAQNLLLPVFHDMTREQQDHVIQAIDMVLPA